MTVTEFIETRYWPRIKPTLCPEWQERTEHYLKVLIVGLGHLPIDDVPIEEVDGWWLSVLPKYRTPVTPNKILVRGKHVFQTAKRWKLTTENPFAHLRRKKEPQRQFRMLTDTQHQALVECACDSLKQYILFARYTGGRRSSLAKLEERDIDLTHNMLRFRQTKNGEDYAIPIHSALRKLCEQALTGQASRRVLPQYSNVHTVSALFRRLVLKVGVPGFRFHDYRHNVGTQLGQHGAHLKTIMKALGHKDVKSSIRYTHISDEVVGKAMEASL